MNDGIYDLSINDNECNNWNNDKLEANPQLIKEDKHRTIQETNQLKYQFIVPANHQKWSKLTIFFQY